MKVRNENQSETVSKSGRSESEGYVDVDFTTLILSFHQVALHALNVAPYNEDRPRDLPAAKMQIDMLRLLSEKMDGNLDEDEKRLLDNVLYELRMVYVDARKCKE